ncbi:O-acetylhomoserine (thiol)-lyase [Parabacteroides sp. PH5-13]|uniref:PLP-dependent transferase n=1 Tax=unclassified Parabacteroides TaxID=2649774 RepID=UPI0024764F04|nr:MULTISPECIES: PLP-dependent transferase [unclassified Parabacteroides]MDH6305334.1 O-acetylhomoserine (thiol)-lyase [Parabacteroides sp. PH5-39]MDH6320133.1 O-acetylhomoserine (thiol)-lyase [Parabacteroides sp. PH5-13]MDH6323924.1 O-acetylhomoserine (thiol)-lyase [Parabacteroides sp. PH5-8]MDH6385036.1 O-acetylhomoserine (thiol)-lyase [Parabacteroides sp. PH5-17]MDH6394330.1 O-acetylhomoserine (thiol)-lyase [Parabacteroides sp. PFB2-22]
MTQSSFEAQLLHTPYEKADAHKALSMPVYNSVAFEFDSAEAMEEAFCGRSSDHFYSRISNPTVQYFEERVRTVTGALSVTALSSGMAAISNTFFTLSQAGMNIVTSPHLFGNTYSFLRNTLAMFGVEVRFCDLTKPEEVRSNIDNNTCAIFLEIITNPQLEVADLKALSIITKAAGIPLIADTTIIPFSSFNAKDFGVDIELVSSTKYISGGATSVGGLIIDYGSADWSRSKPLETWHGQAGHTAFTLRLRKEIHRNIGAYMTPQSAYMQSLGLETLQIRYQQQASTCLELAKRLELMEGVISVNYTGLKKNPFHAISTSQFGAYPGAMLTFNLISREACFSFMNRLKIIRRATNLFDNKTLAIHPASTIYGSFSDKQRKSMDIKQETIRLSVGLEQADDLLFDIEQAL